jgi:Fe-S cluster biogenesis protein NfuA
MNKDLTIKVQAVIDKIRPYIIRDGGDIELIRVEDGIVYVKMLGACVGCQMIDYTLKDGLEAMLIQEIPGIIAVMQDE